MKRLSQLDSLRIVMMGLIIFSHFEFLDNYLPEGIYFVYLHNAILSVDFFFMLAGFGMYYNLHTKEIEQLTIIKCIKYGIERIKKIYPIYIFSLIISLPLVLKNQNILVTTFLLFVDLTLLQSATMAFTFSNSINAVAWFLSTLFICSIASLPIIKYIKKKNTNFAIISLSIIGIIIVVLHFFLLKLDGQIVILGIPMDNFSYGSPIIRIFYVIMGILIAKIYISFSEKYNLSKKVGNTIEIIWVILCIAYLIGRTHILATGISWIYISLDIIACSGLLFIMSLGAGSISRWLSNENLAKIGRRCMYIYLLHYPVRNYVILIFKEDYFGKYTGIVMALIITIFSFIISEITRILYEKIHPH